MQQNLLNYKYLSDLALEAHELLRGETKQEIAGVREDIENFKNAAVRKIEILNETGEKKLKKKQGNYITIESNKIKEFDKEIHQELAKILGDNISQLLSNLNIKKEDNILVVGLGNWDATPDALGPRVIDKIYVTRHLYQYAPESISPNIRSVSAFSPGVLGITGIETAEVLKGICEKTQPAAVIVIDSLAAGDLKRINSTIQISDTGINPGSGIGNTRKGINKEYLNVPVIALGVPTVIRAAVLIFSALNNLLDKKPDVDKHLDQNTAEKILEDVLNPYGGELTVTPKEVDSLITNTSEILSSGINQGLHFS